MRRHPGLALPWAASSDGSGLPGRARSFPFPDRLACQDRGISPVRSRGFVRRFLNIALMALGGILGPSACGDAPEEKSRAALDAWLAGVMEKSAIKIEPKVTPVDDEIVRKVFPRDRFYVVHMPRWPVAVKPPPGLSYETLVRIRPDEPVEPIRDEEALKAFFARSLAGVIDQEQARTAVLAAFRLTGACAKGGPFKFSQPEVSIVPQGDALLGTARAAVQEPDRGAFEVRVEFGPNGRIKPDAIQIMGRPRPGPPPR